MPQGLVIADLGNNPNSLPFISTFGNPSAATDAFGRLRVSNPVTIFDSKQLVDKQPLFWDDQLVSGSGGASTYNTNQSSTTLSVASSTAAVRVRQTFRRFNYQPGKSQLILLTGIFDTGGTGIIKRIGQFDANNGLFFEQNGTTLNVVRRTKTSGTVVDNPIAQSSWNIDKLDGTGESGITLDVTKTQIFVIDYQWLGVGTVRFGFEIDGKLYYVHQINNANNLNLVYMSTPNLPLRVEIINDGTGAANSLTHICASVVTEGGLQETGFSLATDRGATPLVTLNDTSFYPLVALRLKSTYLGVNIDIKKASIVVSSSTLYHWVLLLNPTVVGTALSFTGITNSALEAGVGTTNATTVTGGTVLDSGYELSQNESELMAIFPNKLAIGSNIANTSDILVLAVQRITGTTESFYAGLTWNETI